MRWGRLRKPELVQTYLDTDLIVQYRVWFWKQLRRYTVTDRKNRRVAGPFRMLKHCEEWIDL